MPKKLSICIATYKRGAFIGETLDSILSQLEPGVELVVVDGASPDNTPEVMAEYSQKNSAVRYFREIENSGVDGDFDKAVGYAQGEYCWLMTDDDLLKPGAIARVLSELDSGEELYIVNAEVRNIDLSVLIESRRLKIDADRIYRAENRAEMFAEVAEYLSFIGCVVVRRSSWLKRDRSSYYGSLFIHVGVVFQSPAMSNVKAISESLIIVRYGNAMWTSRRFEIWAIKWPKLVWSFPDFSDAVKLQVFPKEPWRKATVLFKYRALGAYGPTEFHKFWPKEEGIARRVMPYLMSLFPATLANAVMVLYFTKVRHSPMTVQDLMFSHNAGLLSRFVARKVGLRSI